MSMKNKALSLSVAMGMMAGAGIAYAAPLSGSAAFFGGGLSATEVSSMSYYQDASVGNLGYGTFASDAKADYDGISSANIGYTSAGSDPMIRAFAGNYGLDFAGIIDPFKRGGTSYVSAGVNEGWDMVQIRLNDYYMDYYGYSTANRHKTTVHEFGHSLGLMHQDSATDSVMKQGLYTYTNPTSLDISNLQWKY
ncbi:matrixin family metalloprotease [Brevibacillus dissolubilis]|uniref:matrixin family metalloprotease n=1 Tax=Brevibacillus dissolubilis TaxID=1844116 RepID=UPI0011166838|nr:matrixin family metalloprotease [Brevibacillus dissolubilis]